MKASGSGRFVGWGSRADHPPDQGSHRQPERFSPSARGTRPGMEVSLPGGKQVPPVVPVCFFSSDSPTGTVLRP